MSGATTHTGSTVNPAPAASDAAEPASRKGGRRSAEIPGEHLVAGELSRVDDRLSTLLEKSARPPLPEVAAHLIEAGGKRVRPLTLLLSSRIIGTPEDQAIHLACAAELIHSATLLHDDVLDDAELRRGRPASRVLWGNAFSVLAGDLCLSLALSEVEKAGDMRAIASLVSTVQAMVSAEVVQLDHRGKVNLSRELYFDIITGKTASLISWCAAMAHLGPEDLCGILARFGMQLGLAFQIADDVLDYQVSPVVTGKTVGRDLAEGKLTLPIIEAIEEDPALASRLARLTSLETGASDLTALHEEIAESVRESGALERSRNEAMRYAVKARKTLEALPPSPFRDALSDLSLFTASRVK